MKKSELVDSVSYSFLRNELQTVDKFEVLLEQVGYLYAKQQIRPIGRYHTHYFGYRTELDYTKYVKFLFPTEHWPRPIPFYTGFGVDDFSGVIKGFVTTIAPSTRSTLRLYRNSVLPPSLWLPKKLHPLARFWDAFGLEVVVAIDNSSDFTSEGMQLVFLANGTIVLRMPVKRGDLKGTVERVHSTCETQCMAKNPGYLPRQYVGLDPRYTKVRAKAEAAANQTVEDNDTDVVKWITQDYNEAPHAQYRGSTRNQVMRRSQEQVPIILPAGLLHIRSTFALTFKATLLREGVQVARLKFNSTELGLAFRRYSGPVKVKVDPDDIRSVLVIVPKFSEPIEAQLTTLSLPFPVSLELLNILLDRVGLQGLADDEAWPEEYVEAALTELAYIQSKEPTPTPGRTVSTDAEAAAHAAATPPAPAPSATKANANLEDFLRGSHLSDE